MKKWEYATVPLMIHTTKAILDNWGATPASNMVAPTQGNPIAYFKREKAD